MLGVSVEKLSPEEKEKMMEHVRYEYDMLCYTANRINEINRSENIDKNEKNAFIESFLIHARNLNHFFYNSSKNDNDVIASHLVEDWEKEKNTIEGVDYNKIHQKLAHLTKSRPEKNEWPIDDWKKAFTNKFIVFEKKFLEQEE